MHPLLPYEGLELLDPADGRRAHNLIKEVPQLAVPVFLFLGRHDHTAPSKLSEEFYASLQAPYKELIWFEGPHTPDLDEPERFQREVIKIGEAFCREEAMAAAEVAG